MTALLPHLPISQNSNDTSPSFIIVNADASLGLVMVKFSKTTFSTPFKCNIPTMVVFSCPSPTICKLENGISNVWDNSKSESTTPVSSTIDKLEWIT